MVGPVNECYICISWWVSSPRPSTVTALEVSEPYLPERWTIVWVLDVNPITWTDISPMVVPVTKSCSVSDVWKQFKMISDLLCYVRVKKGFLCAKTLAVVLWGEGGFLVPRKYHWDLGHLTYQAKGGSCCRDLPFIDSFSENNYHYFLTNNVQVHSWRGV